MLQTVLIFSNTVNLGSVYTKVHCEFMFDALKYMFFLTFIQIYNIFIKHQFRLDSSRRKSMIRSAVKVKNCLDLIFEGLPRHLKSVFLLILAFSGAKRLFYWSEATFFRGLRRSPPPCSGQFRVTSQHKTITKTFLKICVNVLLKCINLR